MSWSNVRLILLREVRDQLRDRRTMFMIFVLPLLLYPLMGMSFLQVAQFIREHPTSVLVLGAAHLPGEPDYPRLIAGERFADNWFDSPDEARLLELHFEDEVAGAQNDLAATAPASPARQPPRPSSPADDGAPDEGDSADHPADSNDLEPGDQPAVRGDGPLAASAAGWSDAALLREAQALVREGKFEVLVYFPPDFADRVKSLRQELAAFRQLDPSQRVSAPEPAAPSPIVLRNSAREKSQLAYSRVLDVLERWGQQIGAENLRTGGVPPSVARPFEVTLEDVASATRREAAVWAKIFPVLLLVWALTGAFYPAVDLCAGEKERGTLETLLSSPAERTEIVWGKLLTVMLFSMATVVFNVVSMGLTGLLAFSQLPHIGPPPLLSMLWLLVALVPISALFSALCLALAAFARSTKEGQYYLLPLIVITFPLVVLPLAPGVELNLGKSLIPITGVMLLLRNLMEGSTWQVLPFVPPVVAVTLSCCLLAIRWAVDQFSSEAVLFREGERLELGTWIRHLVRDRDETPSVAEAIFCGVLILVIRFFMTFALEPPRSIDEFAVHALTTQLVVILTPALLMTIMLTRSPRKTLLLRVGNWTAILASALLALTLQPAVNLLQALIARLYPLEMELASELERIFAQPHSLIYLLVVMALVPAVCEELAFRGFILSGLRHWGHRWRAIVLTSLLFAMAHAIFQQSIAAFIIGIPIGYLAVQTGSLLPPIVFHACHNGLLIASTRIPPEASDQYPALRWVLAEGDALGSYTPWAVVAGLAVAAALGYWFHRLPSQRTAEEALQEAIDQNAAHSLAG